MIVVSEDVVGCQEEDEDDVEDRFEVGHNVFEGDEGVFEGEIFVLSLEKLLKRL